MLAHSIVVYNLPESELFCNVHFLGAIEFMDSFVDNGMNYELLLVLLYTLHFTPSIH